MKKISMFSDGALVVAENGNVRKANKNEISNFIRTASDEDTAKILSKIFPSEKNGNELSHVRLDRETGYAYGKYANTSKLLKLKVLAQAAPAKQTEPLNSGDKADPSLDVPRDESKGKPQEHKGRKDVNSPKKIREEKYEKGQGGKSLHTNEIPRDSGGDGVGGESTSFEDENSDKATSGNPDSYVQDWKESEKPEKAGSEKNHAVAKALDIKIKHAGDDLRLNLVEGMDHKRKEEKKNEKPKDSKEEEKASKETKEAQIAVVELKEKLASHERTIQKLERELNNRKIAEARKEAAIGLVLAYKDRQPEKYASAEAFTDKVTEIAKKMSVESIDSTLEEFNTLVRAEAEKQKKIAKQASTNDMSAGLSHPLVIPKENYKFAESARDTEDLASVLMESTTLGRSVSNMARYHQSTNE